MVAERDGRVVGFAYVTYEERNYAELAVTAAHLHDIYVDEDARHSGAGQKLIEGAIEAGKQFGTSKLMLSVAVKNIFGREFFEKSGFRPTMTEMTLNLS